MSDLSKFIEGVHYTRGATGRIYPIIRGGADGEPGESGLGDGAASADDTGAVAPVDDTPAAPEVDFDNLTPDADLPTEVDQFPRTYVEKVRQEAAKYRTKAKTYDEAFDGYDDDSREVFLSLARDLVNAPEDAARRMIEVSRSLLGDEFDNALTGEPKPLTQADVQKMLEQKEAAAQEEAAIRAVEQEARDLGYKDKTPEISELFWFAHNETGGDLKAAHEKVQARQQAAVEAYIAKKREAGEAFVTTSTDGISADNGAEPPKTFEEARARTFARLAGEPGQ